MGLMSNVRHRGSLKLGALAALVLPGLGMDGQCAIPGIPDGAGCDPLDTPSVRVTVTNDTGDLLPRATIAFRVNGSQPAFITCNGGCVQTPIAFGTVGRFEIVVTAPGYLDGHRTVDVISTDGCRPQTQDLIIVMSEDESVAALAGAWHGDTLFGEISLRFGEQGEIIGAILFDRTIAGDGNFYISYNNRPIRGVPGQDIAFLSATDPTRSGDLFTFVADTLGVPVGFQNAGMSEDFFMLSGRQPGTPEGFFVTYERLAGIPEALQDP